MLNVHLLPDLADPHDLAGHTSIVVDVLRASTTITTALDSGAEKVIPCLTVEEARELAAKRSGALLGGERQGQKLPGFNFGNSPAEYTSESVSKRTIIFTTTNGTKAMSRCIGSSRILIGAVVNRSAVCKTANRDDRIDILCAGTNGHISMDDCLAAGAIVHGCSADRILNDSALMCRQLWRANVEARQLGETKAAIRDILAQSIGGKNLIALKMDSDLDLAADLDRFRPRTRVEPIELGDLLNGRIQEIR